MLLRTMWVVVMAAGFGACGCEDDLPCHFRVSAAFSSGSGNITCPTGALTFDLERDGDTLILGDTSCTVKRANGGWDISCATFSLCCTHTTDFTINSDFATGRAGIRIINGEFQGCTSGGAISSIEEL